MAGRKADRVSHSRRIHGLPILGLSLIWLAATASAAQAGGAAPVLPTGGKVAAGSAVIGAPAGGSLTIDQTSSRAIIDWSSFSIGAAARVRFDNGSGATLNRVTGSSGSMLDGPLGATGSVYLINPNGVIIGRHGEVRVGGGFVASSLVAADNQFMAGGALTFSGSSTAAVVNYGKIGALGGDVALVAARVVNDGAIDAANGDAGLLAGYRVTLRDKALDDGKFAVLLGGAATSATNAGIIEAADAELRANGGNVYALAGNTGGIIEASGVRAGDGHVWLVAEDGTLDVAGRIEAKGARGSAGAIEASGQSVSLGKGAIDAHGGTWLVDPYDLTVGAVAASTIDASLAAGTSVSLQTTATGASGPGDRNPSGNGDIIIASALSWNSSAQLSLSAYRNIDVDADITVSGGGSLSLTSGTGVAGDYIIAGGQSISFTGGAAAGAKLAINGAPYTLIYSMADLQAINASDASLQSNYALATSLDAATDPTTPANWVPIGQDDAGVILNQQEGFTGVFEGLNHTISNLNVKVSYEASTGHLNDAALFGYSSGAFRDFGVVGGSVTGGNESGGVIGFFGDFFGGAHPGADTITNVYATDAVTCSGDYCGGLVGLASGIGQTDAGVISNSYATGAVVGRSGFGYGGLVGTFYAYEIINSYATGAVSGPSAVGGLVGYMSDRPIATRIIDSYSTGSVADGGGLVGFTEGGTIVTDGYWDTGTSGQSGSDGGTGRTTAQLQGVLPAGFSSSVWGTGPGLYPYLLSQYASGAVPQAVSGFASAGGTALSTTTVALLIDGVAQGPVTTGANGYYYFLTAPGTISSAGSDLALYLPGAKKMATSFYEATGTLGGTTLTGGDLDVTSPAATQSALLAQLDQAVGSASDAGLLYTQAGGFARGIAMDMTLTAPSFDLDERLDLGKGSLEIDADGSLSEASGGVITAGSLSGSSAGPAEFRSGRNRFATLAGFTTDGGGYLYLADADADDLTVTGLVDAGTRILTLRDAGTITERGAGALDAGYLRGDATGSVKLAGANMVKYLTLFTHAGSGDFTLNDGEALVVTKGEVLDVAGGALSLTSTGGPLYVRGLLTADTVNLASGANAWETDTGNIQASLLNVTAQTGIVLLSPLNTIAAIGVDTTTAGRNEIKQ